MPPIGHRSGECARLDIDQENALEEARDAFFTIRLWDAGALLEAIFKNYEKFDDELKAELPLKRIWGLVLEE